jgi:hypothetical protein
VTALSDAKIASFAAAIYAPGAIPWDHYDPGDGAAGVCWGLKHCVGVDVVALRGSATLRDWLRNICALADPLDGGELGPVHPGFMAGMRETWATIRPLLEQPVVVTGHSLGAARASILTALMTLDGFRPLRRVVFGEPRPGFAQLARIVGAAGRSYCNSDDAERNRDPVCDLPFSFPPEEYVRATPLAFVSAPPTPQILARLGPFSLHDMSLYLKALA